MLMLTAIREAQIPLLAAVLLGACAAKIWRMLRPHAETDHSDPSALFPAHLRRPIMALVFAAELGLGLGLIGTALRFPGTGFTDPGLALPAMVVRAGTALFFLVAAGVLNEMRQRRPDAGCGCFGELSGTPIGLRTIARAGLLCASAVASFGLPSLRMPSSTTVAELWLAVLAFELALLAFLSPELGEIMVRLGYSEPCELRRMAVGRTMTALHASAHWRKYAGQVTAGAPSDVWREGCWRFVVYPGYERGRRVDIVFAVYLQNRRPAIRVAVLDADTDEVLGHPATASLPLSSRL
jgi:multisubunit Na+/H+ antiporter MnhB subunit